MVEGRNGCGFVDRSGGLVAESCLRFLSQAMDGMEYSKILCYYLNLCGLKIKKVKIGGKGRRKSGCSHYLTNAWELRAACG